MFNSYDEYILFLQNSANNKLGNFNKKLIKTSYEILGLSIPFMRSISKETIKNKFVKNILTKSDFVYYEEVMIYGFVLANIKINEQERLELINKFLNYIDNWAICDSFCASLKVVKKHKEEYLLVIEKFLRSSEVYTVRTGINLLMDYFLDETDNHKYLMMVSEVKIQEYYVEMSKAWFFATSLAKHFQETYDFIIKNKSKFSESELKKIISKCRDSYRISSENKIKIKENLAL